MSHNYYLKKPIKIETYSSRVVFSIFLRISTMSQWLCVFVILAISHIGVYGQGLSNAEEAEILRAHNYFRGIVDPVATNMLKLVREFTCIYIF